MGKDSRTGLKRDSSNLVPSPNIVSFLRHVFKTDNLTSVIKTDDDLIFIVKLVAKIIENNLVTKAPEQFLRDKPITFQIIGDITSASPFHPRLLITYQKDNDDGSFRLSFIRLDRIHIVPIYLVE